MTDEEWTITSEDGFTLILPGGFKPTQFAPSSGNPSVFRAYGSSKMISISDNIGTTANIVLEGSIFAEDEAKFLALLTVYADVLKSAKYINRPGWPSIELVVGASWFDAETYAKSKRAKVKINLVPKDVHTSISMFRSP